MVSNLISVIQSLSVYSSNSFFVFMPFLIIARLVFASYNMESSRNIMESFQGLVSVILFVSLFKMFYPTIIETGLTEVLITNINIDTPWFSNILMFTMGQIMGFLVVIVKTLNLTLIFLCLCLVAFSLPISFSASRIYNFSYLWLFNKTILIAVFFWLISMYLFNIIINKNDYIDLTSYSILALELIRHCISLIVFIFVIKKQLSYTPTGNSLDSVQNQMLSALSPQKYEQKVREGLGSGKYRIDESGAASDLITHGYLNRKATEQFRDNNLSEFIKKSGLKSISEAENQIKSPQTYAAITNNAKKEKNSINKIISEKGLTNISEANMIHENPDAFSLISSNKKNDGILNDQKINSLIKEGKASSISEAKNMLQYQESSQTLNNLNKSKQDQLLASIKTNSFESMSEASLYMDNKPAFDQIQINKTNNASKFDSNLNNLISSGKASSIPEAKQLNTYPTAFEAQKIAFNENTKKTDNIYSEVIKNNDVFSIGEAKNFVELPKSWKAVKQKTSSGNN